MILTIVSGYTTQGAEDHAGQRGWEKGFIDDVGSSYPAVHIEFECQSVDDTIQKLVNEERWTFPIKQLYEIVRTVAAKFLCVQASVIIFQY